jgi:hypothetical protein
MVYSTVGFKVTNDDGTVLRHSRGTEGTVCAPNADSVDDPRRFEEVEVKFRDSIVWMKLQHITSLKPKVI